MTRRRRVIEVHYTARRSFGATQYDGDDQDPAGRGGALLAIVALDVPPDLTVPADGHNRALACATDVAATAPCIKFAAPARLAVPLTDPGRCRADP